MPHAVFLVNLLQDVNTLRPLMFMAARGFGFTTDLLVTRFFSKRDKTGAWRRELKEIAAAIGASMVEYTSELEALNHLQGRKGLLFAGSESNLSGHSPTHDLFRMAPPSFVTVTLQHGLECVGFLQNRDHDLAHGREVSFAADIVCAWCEEERLTALAPSQRGKLHVTGPSALLQQRPRVARGQKGIICENLHSVRLNIAGDFKADFVSTFQEFCAALAAEGGEVVLRPHPGGQYVLKNGVSLPDNVTLNNNPIYKVDLSAYAYGISAPSSILIDMILAGIPTAVWRDSGGVMDADNYQGLTEISSASDWLDFSREATIHPERFIEAQQRFIERQKMPLDPADVYRRYAALFAAAERRSSPVSSSARARERGERVMFVANAFLPTLQLSFIKPLAPLLATGAVTTTFVTEDQMSKTFGEKLRDSVVHGWLDEQLAAFNPSLIVFCRYSGPHAEYITAWARRRGIPTIYHIDDDLLSIPPDLGKAKHEYHNHPLRLAAVRHMLTHADLVYCSTPRLKKRLLESGASAPLMAGTIYASGTVISRAALQPVRKVGYMGFIDHVNDLKLILPAIVQFLRRNTDVVFELFGSLPLPPELAEFGKRIELTPKIMNYENFLIEFAKREWQIGLCPLVSTPFNLLKADTKWVEYTSVGAAVIASRGTVYDECCVDGCGLLAETTEEWLGALETLTKEPATRYAQVRRAQEKLLREYSSERLQEQVLDIFHRARTRGDARALNH